MFDGGVLINVLGRLQVSKRRQTDQIWRIKWLNFTSTFAKFAQTDGDPPHAYTQTFILKPIANSFFVQHDIFRLALHDMA